MEMSSETAVKVNKLAANAQSVLGIFDILFSQLTFKKTYLSQESSTANGSLPSGIQVIGAGDC